MKHRIIKVKVDVSTWRWLRALARANSKATEFQPAAKLTEADILAQAAFCFADAAGRRAGSWEASVGQSLLDSSGFQQTVTGADWQRCEKLDAIANAKFRAALAAKETCQPKP